MPSLKDLRLRINSVKATRKITSAMKMVAASKLRRAQAAAESARPYVERMERMLGTLAAGSTGRAGQPALLVGTGRDDVHLIVVITSDRGLCGGFNSSVVRSCRALVNELLGQGKTVKLMLIGRKGRDQLRREFSRLFLQVYDNIGRKGVAFAEADAIARKIGALYAEGAFDVCTVIYNLFKSAISQEVTRRRLIPFPIPERHAAETPGPKAICEVEPDEETVLGELLPRNLAVQLFHALLESNASEQGARMAAMDNATRNAGEMIDALNLRYNRTRQAMITKELIEIISGAEAL
jgi:F-type H+-transporting ATPase subunit gamma